MEEQNGAVCSFKAGQIYNQFSALTATPVSQLRHPPLKMCYQDLQLQGRSDMQPPTYASLVLQFRAAVDMCRPVKYEALYRPQVFSPPTQPARCSASWRARHEIEVPTGIAEVWSVRDSVAKQKYRSKIITLPTL